MYQHNPAKLPECHQTANEWVSKEPEMWQLMCDKYGAPARDTIAQFFDLSLLPGRRMRRPKPQGLTAEQIFHPLQSFLAVGKPVLITMILASLAVVYIHEPNDGSTPDAAGECTALFVLVHSCQPVPLTFHILI
jgi:hypothetical protein